MRAVVLVGGFGTRLRPLTNDLPKQMVPVVRVPMIERVVAALGSYGVTEAVLSLGYRPDAFIDAYPDGVCAGVVLHYAVEPDPLDTAGAVRFAVGSTPAQACQNTCLLIASKPPALHSSLRQQVRSFFSLGII